MFGSKAAAPLEHEEKRFKGILRLSAKIDKAVFGGKAAAPLEHEEKRFKWILQLRWQGHPGVEHGGPAQRRPAADVNRGPADATASVASW